MICLCKAKPDGLRFFCGCGDGGMRKKGVFPMKKGYFPYCFNTKFWIGLK